MVRLRQVAALATARGAHADQPPEPEPREVLMTANVVRPPGRRRRPRDDRRSLAASPLPPGYRYRFGGSTKDMQETLAYAVSALALAVIFIYMILA